MRYSENLRYPKHELKARAEKISEEMNVHLDADASKEELANWLSIMEPHYEKMLREEAAAEMEERVKRKRRGGGTK